MPTYQFYVRAEKDRLYQAAAEARGLSVKDYVQAVLDESLENRKAVPSDKVDELFQMVRGLAYRLDEVNETLPDLKKIRADMEQVVVGSAGLNNQLKKLQKETEQVGVSTTFLKAGMELHWKSKMPDLHQAAEDAIKPKPGAAGEAMDGFNW